MAGGRRGRCPVPNPQSPISFGPLTFLGLELADWPRWRQTKVAALWRVEDGFVPGTVRPWLEIRTPSGAEIVNDTQLPTPALVWYPPERWQAGEVIRLESLWLFLPGVWGVAVGVAHGPQAQMAGDRLPVLDAGGGLVDSTGTLGLAGVFQRAASGALVDPGLADEMNGAAPSGFFAAPAGERIAVATRLDDAVAAGQAANLWLLWRAEQPEQFARYQVFVHLRQGGETIAQNDGSQRLVIPLLPSTATPDWRQLPIPADLPSGDYSVVVGLFDPVNGERLPAFHTDGQPAGNELPVGNVRITPHLVSDQVCALIPLTCDSQK